jgi:uncharacterized protein (DUF4415 family)
MSKEKPVIFDDDNPEWTEADFARAKRGDDIPAAIRAAFPKSKGGRPAGSNKEQVSLRIDKDVLERFRAGGPGWQSRMNEALRKAVA